MMEVTASSVSFGISLAMISAVSTAGAHALLKAGKDKLAVRTIIGLTGTTVSAPVCFFVPLPTMTMLPWLVSANLLHTVYQLAQIRSYTINDFSIAYPLSRGIVPIATVLLGVTFLGDEVTFLSIVGILIISIGILVIAGYRSIALSGLAAAFLVGLLTTAYTLVDAKAIRLAPQALTFVSWFFVLDGLFILPIFAATRYRQISRDLRAEVRQGILAGLASLICFGTALFALRLAPVGIVSGLRETSVVFAMIIATTGLKENVDRRHIFGAIAVALGAIITISGSL